MKSTSLFNCLPQDSLLLSCHTLPACRLSHMSSFTKKAHTHTHIIFLLHTMHTQQHQPRSKKTPINILWWLSVSVRDVFLFPFYQRQIKPFLTFHTTRWSPSTQCTELKTKLMTVLVAYRKGGNRRFLQTLSANHNSHSLQTYLWYDLQSFSIGKDLSHSDFIFQNYPLPGYIFCFALVSIVTV